MCVSDESVHHCNLFRAQWRMSVKITAICVGAQLCLVQNLLFKPVEGASKTSCNWATLMSILCFTGLLCFLRCADACNSDLIPGRMHAMHGHDLQHHSMCSVASHYCHPVSDGGHQRTTTMGAQSKWGGFIYLQFIKSWLSLATAVTKREQAWYPPID